MIIIYQTKKPSLIQGFLMRANAERIETTAAQTNAIKRTAAAPLPWSKNESKSVPNSSFKLALISIPAPNAADELDNNRYDNNYIQ